MCDFVSWIEKDGEVLYLNDAAINSKRGRELREHLGPQFNEDVKGHGAIRWFYEMSPETGINKECTDFTSPKNFPKEVVNDIRDGKFRLIGFCLNLLTKPAWAEYEKIKVPALAEYKKIKGPALAEYEKIKVQAWAEYEKIVGQAFWDLFKAKKNRIKEWR